MFDRTGASLWHTGVKKPKNDKTASEDRQTARKGKNEDHGVKEGVQSVYEYPSGSLTNFHRARTPLQVRTRTRPLPSFG